jgi:pimeloyl-ACP methyl ester carboxylesterase
MSNSPLQNPPADYFPAGSDNWFLIPEGKDAGKHLFYYDYSVGPGEPEATVVLVHGNPESSYTYRHIRDSLIESGKSTRIIAMDHIGFGISDQATFEMVEIHHSDNLLQLVRYLDLKDVTLAVHDWGGPIGVGTFIQEPWRVKNLLVMNTVIFPMPSDGYTYRNYPISWLPWCNVPKVIPDVLWGGVAAYVVSHASPQGALPFIAKVSWYCLKHALHLFPKGTPEYVWSQMLRSRANSKSSQRNVLQTPHWGNGWTYHDPAHGVQDNKGYYQRMHRDVPAVWGPEGQNIKVCGYFGHWDACGKKSVILQWQEALPQMKDSTFEFPEIGHFIEEYKGPEMAASILEMNGL